MPPKKAQKPPRTSYENNQKVKTGSKIWHDSVYQSWHKNVPDGIKSGVAKHYKEGADWIADGSPWTDIVHIGKAGEAFEKIPDNFNSITIADFILKTDPDATLSVFDRTLSTLSMTGRALLIAIGKKKRRRLLNTVGIDYEGSELQDHLNAVPIQRLRQLDLLELYYPKSVEEAAHVNHLERRPRMRHQATVTMAKFFTEFHGDFSGSSFWIVQCKGVKQWFLAPPTIENYRIWIKWSIDPERKSKFLGHLLEGVVSVEMTEGNALLVGGGWLHAVFTMTDSAAVGGSFLSENLSEQLSILDMERNDLSHRDDQSFPEMELIMLYAMVGIHRRYPSAETELPDQLLEGMQKLVGYLDEWLPKHPDFSLGFKQQIAAVRADSRFQPIVELEHTNIRDLEPEPHQPSSSPAAETTSQNIPGPSKPTCDTCSALQIALNEAENEVYLLNGKLENYVEAVNEKDRTIEGLRDELEQQQQQLIDANAEVSRLKAERTKPAQVEFENLQNAPQHEEHQVDGEREQAQIGAAAPVAPQAAPDGSNAVRRGRGRPARTNDKWGTADDADLKLRREKMEKARTALQNYDGNDAEVKAILKRQKKATEKSWERKNQEHIEGKITYRARIQGLKSARRRLNSQR